MKPLHKIIQDKFRKSRYANVKEWHQATGCALSVFTCTRIINQDTEPSLETGITILYHLNTPTSEIIQICKDHGDKVFWRLMQPCEVSPLTLEIEEALKKDPTKEAIVRGILAL